MTRRRFRWNDETQALEEVASDYEPHDATQPVYTDRYMEGVRTIDGVDISSRRKRRDYMRAAGVTDAADFKDTWAQKAKEREAAFKPGNKERREAIARAMYQRSTGRR